ncbi:cytochrome c [Aquabacterium sp. A08]|uniref:c-type cytochrome n=1 Tax=Aquabacterium sp. A08 TaxID=2718532 RepID=UPI001422FEBE|nr:cytochrome c [Aquabacterium sp. A08]NIC41756.1 cytochrome c [Aquabacterium sp. A08]
MKVHLGWALVSALMLTAGTAQAQFQKPEDAVKYRQSAFSVMGTHFSRIGAMANGRVPFDAKAAQDNAAIVLAMSKLPWAGFTPDTEKVKSRAKPELWMEMTKVQAGADKMVAAVVALDAAARTGNLDSVKKAFGETAATCKACHDAYRE